MMSDNTFSLPPNWVIKTARTQDEWDTRNKALVRLACEFAKWAHGSQVRKYTGEPYWHHLRNVAEQVSRQTTDPEIIAAAWLHDVLEDTEISELMLAVIFGPRVAVLVHQLTDQYTKQAYPQLNRAERKRRECERLSKVSPEAKLIKRADIEDNTPSIVEHDPGFAKVYLKEKEELLDAIT